MSDLKPCPFLVRLCSMDGQIIGYTCKGECANCPAEDALTAEVERLKAGLRKLWYVCRERRKRPYIDHREYNFLFGIEGKLESLLATDTNVPTNAPDTNVGTMEG